MASSVGASTSSLCASTSESDSGSQSKRRSVTYATYQKWCRDFDRELQTMSWLDCSTTYKDGRKILTHLRCTTCAKFEARIKGRRNYSARWIDGADSLRTSNIRDHATSAQHIHATSLLRQEHALAKGESVVSYAPIAKALFTLDEGQRIMLRHKFDIAYFVAREKLSFRKYPQLVKLESKHGVSVGTNYTTETAGKEITHYIAKSVREKLCVCLSAAKFFSLMLDGSTDSGNIENEILLAIWFDQNGPDEKVYTKTSYFNLYKPSSTSAEGIMEGLSCALKKIGISELHATTCFKLVGFGTDGASANIAKAGLKGLVERELPWIFWMWCLAHRLELAVKDAFKNTAFNYIDDMLLRLYYLYEKSPKKCRQLEDIINDLRDCLAFDDFGKRPVRASGSRWIAHKWNAMKRILSKYGAYTSHLAALSQDNTLKSTDRAKMKGYYDQWIDAKYLLGCALFVDLYSPVAILSKLMQKDDLDILAALTGLLNSVKELDKLKSKPLTQWPAFATTLDKCTIAGESVTYQCQELKRFTFAKTYYENHYNEYCDRITQCTRERLCWSDIQLLRDIIFVLATQGWQKAVDEKNDLKAVDRLVDKFCSPLNGADAQVNEIHAEFEAMMHYATQYISLSTLEYRSVWWRLYHAPSASEWSNTLILVELLFSLPASNGKVERVFSQVNLIKSNRRVQLSTETLNDLLTIATHTESIEDFNPDPAIDLWWKDKVRRPSQKPRKPYKKRAKLAAHDENSSNDCDDDVVPLLDIWDEWMASSSSESEQEQD